MAHGKGSGSHGAVPGRNASIAARRSGGSRSNGDDRLYTVDDSPFPFIGDDRKYGKLKIEDLREMLDKLKEWGTDAKNDSVEAGLEKAYYAILNIVRFNYHDGVFKEKYE